MSAPQQNYDGGKFSGAQEFFGENKFLWLFSHSHLWGNATTLPPDNLTSFRLIVAVKQTMFGTDILKKPCRIRLRQ